MNVGLCHEIIDQLEDKKIDIALIESPVFREGIIYREWVLEELIVFSNQPLKKHGFLMPIMFGISPGLLPVSLSGMPCLKKFRPITIQ